MYALAPLALFLATAAAVPQPAANLIPRDTLATMTVAEAQGACGAGQTISCCNKNKGTGDETNGGLLSGLLNGVLEDGVLGQCSKLNVAALIGVTDLLNSQCKGNVACCEGNAATSTGPSLIGLNLPCIALGSLI